MHKLSSLAVWWHNGRAECAIVMTRDISKTSQLKKIDKSLAIRRKFRYNLNVRALRACFVAKREVAGAMPGSFRRYVCLKQTLQNSETKGFSQKNTMRHTRVRV